MPKRLFHRALPCVMAMTLAACHSSTPPSVSPAPAAAPADSVEVSSSVAVASSAPSTSTTPAVASSAAATVPFPAPEIISLDLLDVGVATAKDTLASLRQRYGAGNVKDGDVPGAEGEELDGWILYPDDPKRRIYIYLDDAGVHPSLLRVLDGESQWRRSDGIHMGLTLTELVARNGQPIEFSGFGWDYGGAISDWHGGKLENQKVGGGLTLCPPDFPQDKYPEDYPSGDAQFSSSNDLVKRYPPVVCEFGVVLDNVPAKP